MSIEKDDKQHLEPKPRVSLYQSRAQLLARIDWVLLALQVIGITLAFVYGLANQDELLTLVAPAGKAHSFPTDVKQIILGPIYMGYAAGIAIVLIGYVWATLDNSKVIVTTATGTFKVRPDVFGFRLIIVGVGLALISIGWCAVAFIYTWVNYDQIGHVTPDRAGHFDSPETNVILIGSGVGGMLLLFITAQVAMNAILTKGVNKSVHRLCHIWFVIQVAFWIFFNLFPSVLPFSPIPVGGIIVIYRAISILIVKNFKDEVQRMNLS